MIEIKSANFPQERDCVVAIFSEYIASPSVSLNFQDVEPELASLPGKYAAPEGGLLLAWKNGAVVGCAAFRKVDESICEMKRVYVRPAVRREGLGLRLIEHILKQAREAGYARICLDVLPEFATAQRIYQSLGFQPAPPVAFNPVPGTQFLGLDLRASC